ncbi:MAG: lipopolysaccharide heptosyltransferase II [Planctomycetes bacterium]|nr:lipopolysaccharide heptosyltransferase II [Planctomycetota bacterium]
MRATTDLQIALTECARGGSDPHSILVVLPTWVGDFVMATPTLRAIRSRFSRAHIVFLIEPNLVDLVRGGDWMNECLEWPAKNRRKPWNREVRQLVAALRARRIDWAILLPNSARSAMLAFAARAKRRIGYSRDGRGFLLTDRIPVKNYVDGKFDPLPLVEYYADLAEAIGCDRPGDELELFTTPDCDESLDKRIASLRAANRHPLVTISPGAKYGAAKCWLPERFAEAADRLIRERGAFVVIAHGPGEEHIAQAIASAMNENAVVFDDPRLTLGELKSLIKRSDLLICNDAGPRHFAKAFRVPVVTIFGPTHPEWTATSYEAERIVRVAVDCGPCQQRTCPQGHVRCMTEVTAGMVVNAAVDLLQPRAVTTTSDHEHG